MPAWESSNLLVATRQLCKAAPALHCSLSCRPVCGVAGIPSSQSSTQHHLQHSAGSSASLPHCSHTGGAGPALAYRTQVDNSPSILMPSGLQAPQPQEQNGILDWLRKLRLHKYYPVFKQLTMEKVRWLLRCAWCDSGSLCPVLIPSGSSRL